MGSGGCLFMMLFLLILSRDCHRNLAFLHWKPSSMCPQVKMNCGFKESNTCSSDKDCKVPNKCCRFNCAKICLDLNEDPCQATVKTRRCSHTLIRWYYKMKDNDCYPIERNRCTDSLNNFQSYHICKATCLEYGHGKPVIIFEQGGEALTVLI
ncbi:eppin-like [Notamacropus eugenii]|uniref:eppin-like n=1 Tax=Notamacropus eugenii TaxID=9315 RepID=UPI003B6776E7